MAKDTTSTTASKGGSQASSAPKQTIRSGAELRELSNARAAVVREARANGTYTPGNTYDKYDSYAYLTLGEKGYNQYAQNKRNSIEYNRALDYLDSGQYNSKDTMKFLNMANQMAGEDGDMVKYNEKTNSLDKTGKWGGSWLELANMFDGLYKENLWDENRNEYDKLDEEKYKLSEEQAKLKQNQANTAKSVSAGMQSGNFLNGYADTLKQVRANDAKIAELDSMMSALNDDLLDKLGTDEEKAAFQRLKDNKYSKVEVYDWSKYAGENFNKDADQALVDDFMVRFGRPKAFYNAEDQALGAYESAEASIKSGLIGARSLIGKALDSNNATDINAETRGGSVTGAIKSSAEQEAQRHKMGLPDSPATDEYLAWYNSYDHSKDNFENLNGIKLRQLVQPELDNVNEEISTIESQLASLNQSPRISAEYANQKEELNNRLRELRKQQTAYNDKLLEAKGQRDKTSIGYKIATDYQRDAFNHWDEVVDQLDAKSQEAIAMAKQNASALGKIALDMEKTGLEMGFDMTVGAFTGSSLVPMFIRVMGNESAAARRDGASLDQQIAYGLTKASIELATEKLFGAFDKIGYGKGIASEFSERVVAKLAETPLGRSVVRAVISMAEEGAEEGIADLLAPIADLIYRKDKNFFELFNEETENFWYDVLLGAAMGGLGFAGGVITGQNAKANYDLYDSELRADKENATKKAKEDAQRYKEAEKSGNQEDIERVISEAGSKSAPQSAVTKARAKMIQLGNKYKDGNIPAEERLTRQEASILKAAGYPSDLVEDMAIPRGMRAATDEEIAEAESKKTKDIKGYVERMFNTDITKRGAERGKARDEEKAKAEEQKRKTDLTNSLKGVSKVGVDTGDIIEKSDIKKTAVQNVTDAEQQLGLTAQDGQSFGARLSAIENELGITPEAGASITSRIDAINKAIYGEEGTPSKIDENAPDGQASQEEDTAPETPEELVKPGKKSKSEKPKKGRKKKQPNAEEASSPVEEKQAETPAPEETAPEADQAPEETAPAEEPTESEAQPEPEPETFEAEEEPATGLEADIRNAKSVEELVSLYNANKSEFNSIYASKWGGGFAVDSQFAKDDLRNLFNDLHPEDAEAPAKKAEEAPAETASEETPEAEEKPASKNHDNAIEKVKAFELSVDELGNLITGKVVTLEEVSEILGKKFSRETKKGKVKKESELRRQVKQWYVKAKAEHNSQLTESDQKTLEAANKKKVSNKAQSDKVKAENAQDKADEESGLKKEASVDDFVEAIKNRIKWREPTPRDVDIIRQWMVDQITKGELTAEEISNLIAKNGHTDDVFDTWKALMRGNGTEESLNEKVRETYSQELIDLAASELTQIANENTGVIQTLLPNIVRENLIRGFNDLTGEDIGLEGSNQAKIIQEAIDNWRGKEAPSLISREELARQHAEQRAAREAARKKAEDAKRAEKRKENEDENPEEPIDRRRVPASIDDFKRLRRGEAGRSTDSGESLALEGEDFEWDNDDEDAYRTDIQPALNKGARFVSYDEADRATQRVVSKLLNGVNGDQNSRIPYVSVIDCSKMSKADFNKLVGAVGKVNSEFPDNGIILFVNAPTKVQGLPPGCVVQHEPVHYFIAKAKQADKSIDFDGLFSAAVDTNNKAQNITMGSEAGRQKKIDRITTSFYKSQLRFSGHDIISGYLAKGQTITEKGFASLLEKDDVAIDNKLRELTGENYESFKAEVMEEAVANIVSANPAMGELVNVYRDAMRSALYDSGLVPKGYFENLDSSANSFTKKQTAVRASNEKASAQTNNLNSADYIDKLANGLSKKGLSDDKIANILCDVNSNLVDAASRQLKISKDDFVKQAEDYFSQTKKASGTKKLIDPSTGKEVYTPHYKPISKEAAEYWLGRNVTPEGAKDTITNKEYNKYTTEAERQRNGGSLEYTSVSEISMAKTAGENLTNGIAKYGYEAVVESYKSAERLNDLETKEVIMLAQMIDQELWYRVKHPGKTKYDGLANSNEVLAIDSKALWDKARISKHESASNLRRNTVLTPELQTINNFIQTWAKNETPESIDPDSDAANIIQFGQDTVARVKEIEEDFNAGNEEQARKAMIDVIKEVNKVRNTRGLFADQIVGGKQLGKAMDFVEASLLNRVLRESDFNTIKMMALGSVNRINSDFEKVGKLNTINQLRYANMLSNFATTVNNLLNNLESATTGALANNIAYDLLNKKTTRIMGEQTLVRSNNDWFSRLAVRSEKRAKNKELNRYMWTKGAESVLSLMYGLDVDEGKIDLDLGAKHNQNSGELGQLMARYQFLTGLKMQTTDAMAIARAYKAMEININSLPISNERKAELRNLAMQEARTQMYHNEDNGVAKALLKARETLDKAHFGDSSLGLGSILVPFVQVPVNVATRALEATPAGVVFDLARGSIALHQLEIRAKQYSEYQDAFEAQKAGKELTDAQKDALDKYANVRKPTDAEVHKAARAIGHAATNASIFAVALLATALNGLKNFDDEEDDELKRLAKEKGWTGLQINMAAMFRPGHEWKDGDPVVGGSWLEVLSIPFAAAYSVANSWMKEDDDGKKGGPGAALKAIVKSPLTTFSQAIDVIAGMPGVDQFYDMWTAYQNLQKYEPDEDKRIAKETASILQYGANTLASFVVPNSMAMATAGIDNKVRDVYTADNNWQVMGNIVKNKLPYFRGKLPVSKDSLGNVRTYGDNVLMGLVNRSVLPGTGVKIWSRSPLEKEWARLKGEGVGGNLMPKKSAPNNITVDGEKYDFNAEEKRSWDDMNTELCVAGQNILINTEGYKNMTDTEKGAALRDVNTLMALVSNQAALDKKDVDAHVELKGWENAYFGDDNGPDMDGLAKYLVAKHTFKNIWDSKAGTFANLEEADTFIDNIYSKLDQIARDTLDSSYGWLDDFSDARKTTGMSAKEFAAAKEIQEKYRDMQDAMRDMADDDENKESLSALSRNMATEFADYFGDGSKRAKWAQDHLRLWVTISASNETLEKWQSDTSLSTKEIDSWLDNKSNLVPQGGYKNPSQNQTFMAIRDFNGISASNQKDLEKKRWEMIKMAASKGEDTDGDDEGDGGAWAKLKPYMEQGYSVEYALDHATYWYKQGKRWVKRKYNRIYPKD